MLQWRTQARAAGCGSAPRPGLPSGASRLPSGPARDPDRGRSWPGHHRRPRDGRRSGGIRPDAMGGGAALTAGRLGTQRCRWRGRPRRDGICLPGAADRGPRRRGAQRGDGGGRGRLYEGDSATSDSETCPLTAPLAWSARSNGRNGARAHGIGRAGGWRPHDRDPCRGRCAGACGSADPRCCTAPAFDGGEGVCPAVFAHAVAAAACDAGARRGKREDDLGAEARIEANPPHAIPTSPPNATASAFLSADRAPSPDRLAMRKRSPAAWGRFPLLRPRSVRINAGPAWLLDPTV
ncbi:hypothetical protein EV657_10332 [Rhodovulum visakhapatnamense]|uniref:Uncharacterized protein n=1 Tax=Rhodovulum visakhapatnamense TaxID=364297 RepID=A0A4R8FZC2_9RHOB|nr:hypothetical protein EV657_10332 [Rhodovulum visakhapatnamense]